MAQSRAAPVSAGDDIEVIDGPRFVGRGGYKLWAALSAFGVSVAGRDCLDIGASTGGFTDCLLQRGARSVVALDVGHDQLAPILQADPRVRSLSGVDIRAVDAGEIGGPFDLVTVDVSFISLTHVTESLAAMTRSGGDALVLVKPQFEVGREGVGRGVVRGAARDAALERIAQRLEEAGFDSLQTMESALAGEAGNREYFVWVRRP
jgi:23S rRNA (cytidine1920-2'-O)/16S rRNA (cytidine1409-2'-O)-methyltransferase